MQLNPLINIKGINPLLWLEGESDPIFLSSRIRIARNIANLPFPHWAKMEELEKVLKLVYDAWKKRNFPFLFFFPLQELSPSERNLFAELHLISREFARGESEGRALLISPDASLSVLLNEEDHIRISALGKGKNLQLAMRRAFQLEEYWAKEIGFAHSPRLGFLTASPSNLGTGIRFSSIAHLPALTLLKGRDYIEKLLADMEIRGLLGEGSEPIGFLYQISTRKTLGIKFEKSFKEIEEAVSIIEKEEREEREILFKRTNIEERIENAYARLSSASHLSTYTATQLLSILRLASAERLIPIPMEKIDILLFLIRPTAIQFFSGRKMKVEERDKERANLLRKNILS
jgi:protein arginine kinase